jgi:hypothetical protein
VSRGSSNLDETPLSNISFDAAVTGLHVVALVLVFALVLRLVLLVAAASSSGPTPGSGVVPEGRDSSSDRLAAVLRRGRRGWER